MTFVEELRRRPFLRLLLPLIIGIISGFCLKPGIILFFISFCILFISLLTVFGITYFSDYKRRWIFGIILNLFLITTGILLCQIKLSKIDYHLTKQNGQFVGTIVEKPVLTEKSVKATIEIEAIYSAGSWSESAGKSIVYIEKDKQAETIDIGDKIIFEPSFEEIKNAGNPDEFDIRKYLAYHMITCQSLLKSSKWKKVENSEFSIFSYASKIRDKVLSVFKANGFENDEYAVLSALTIGYKNELDNEIKRAYSSSGAMHILAVSGLHVGIIFLIFNFLFSFLEKRKQGKLGKAILLILILWSYALLTGLSASVLRATFMLSFVIVGNSLNRKINIFNSIAASAFCLLLYNPLFITELGFLLSYIALTGIVLLQPGIYNLFYFKNKIIDKLWGLVSVSIAAQIATFPLSLFYFHQFPNYFLLTNIIVIPLTSIIIYLALLLLVFSFFEPVAAIISKALLWSVKFLNFSVLNIEQLPFSITENISVTAYQTIGLYLGIALLSLYFFYKNIRYLHYSLLMILILTVSFTINKVLTIKQKKIIVYNIPGVSAINFIDGKENLLLADIKEKNKSKINYHVKNFWINNALEAEKVVPLNQFNDRFLFTNLLTLDNGHIFFKRNYIGYYTKKIVLITRNSKLAKKPKTALNVDFVIISGNPDISVKEIINNYTCNHIIIDSSNSSYKTNEWMEESKNLNVNCHSVNDKGAFICTI